MPTIDINTQRSSSGIGNASAIKVETMNGTVMLSGFAKNASEKSQAENIAANVKGVKSVRNSIMVRP